MYIMLVTFDWTIALSPDNEHFCLTSQKKKYKKANNDLPNIHIKLKIE